ncbi:MAG: 6-phosphogluconolactonase [Chloroflexi bacterium]|nr:MAG: 6-phosphogluconolactonase [Chloroflexota bacterium]
MTDANLIVLQNAEAVARAAADSVAAVLGAAASERGVVHWATTGGSTPVPIYRALTEPPLVRDVPWNEVQLWWGDDRYVPRDHPLSNVEPADQILLRAGALSGQSGWGESGEDVITGIEPAARIPVANVHPIPMAEAIGEARGVAWAAARYEVELRAAGLPTQDGWPVFDLMLLGVGPDSHVMSVFPGSATFGHPEWVLPVPAPTHVEPHVTRVTLNPAVLEVARSIVVVASGAAKADALAAVFGEQRDPREVPAQLARRASATWFVDEAAAAKIKDRAGARR